MASTTAPSGLRAAADPRVVLPALAAWGSAWLAAVRPLLALGLLGVVALVVAVRLARSRAVPGSATLAVAAVLCGVAAVVATTARTATRDGPLTALARDGAVVTLDVTVTDDPRPLSGRVVGARRVADLTVVGVRAETVRHAARALRLRRSLTVFADGPGWGALLPGERLRLRGRLRLPASPGDPPLVMPYEPPARLAPAPLPGRVAGHLRDGLRDAADVLPPDERGLLPGLVVGDTTRLDPVVREDFRRTGLSHLVAVSGQNVAVLLAALLLVARHAGLGPRTAAVLGGLGLAFFVVLARPSPSVLRAATMGAFGLVGTVTGRERAALRLLAGAVLLLVLADPALARSLGFALSTCATAGLLVLAPPWRARLARRLPGWLADAVAAPLAAQVACAPLLAAAFGRVSLVAIPANVLAAPAVAPATLGGFAAAALAPVSPPLARVAAWLAGLPTAWLVRVAREGARLPAGSLGVPSGAAGAALTALLTVATVLLLRRRAGRLVAATTAAGALTATAVTAYVAPSGPPPHWRLVACDVGQGDALVARTSAGAVVVDAGPDPLAADRCLRDLRVRRLAAVVLTHFHADHVEGLPGVFRGRRAPEVVVSPLPEPPDERDRVLRWAAAGRAPVRVAALGERWAAGDAAFEVLGPATAFRGTESDPNNSSLVLRATFPGLTVLLTGDVEEPAQLALLARGAVGRADVLKVPHHGSARQTAEFLTAAGAVAAVVSAGRDNPYGHPAPSTLGALSQRGMRTYRTDRDGDVAVSAGPDGVRVTGRHGPGAPPAATPPPGPADAAPALALAWRRAAQPALWCPVPDGRAALRGRPPVVTPRTSAPSARHGTPGTVAAARDPPRHAILCPCPPRPRSRR